MALLLVKRKNNFLKFENIMNLLIVINLDESNWIPLFSYKN